jgi:hypothetical protein
VKARASAARAKRQPTHFNCGDAGCHATPRDDAQARVARHQEGDSRAPREALDLVKWQARRARLGRVVDYPLHANSKRLDRDVTTTHDSCRGHSALRRRRPGRHACPALPQRRLRHRAELEPRHPPSGREVPHGAVRRARGGSRADRPTTPYRRPSTTPAGSSTRPVSNARSSSGGLRAPRSRCDTRLSTPGGSAD